MINFDEITRDIHSLFEKESGATISKNTGVPYQTVQDLRNGKTKLENARLHTVRKLYEYAKRQYNVEVHFDELGAGTDLLTIVYAHKVYDDGTTYTIDELINESSGQDEGKKEFVEKKLKELGYYNFNEIIEV